MMFLICFPHGLSHFWTEGVDPVCPEEARKGNEVRKEVNDIAPDVDSTSCDGGFIFWPD